MTKSFGLALAVALVVPAAALADGAPSPYIHALAQEEQDVFVELAIPEGPHLEAAYDLVRVTSTTDGQDESALFSGRVFDLDDCVEPCPEIPLFEVVDWCAPPGDHTYSFRREGASVDSETVSVEDTGDDCLLGPEEETDADSGASESSCAVVAPGRAATPASFVIMLLGIGLALRRRPTRSRAFTAR